MVLGVGAPPQGPAQTALLHLQPLSSWLGLLQLSSPLASPWAELPPGVLLRVKKRVWDQRIWNRAELHHSCTSGFQTAVNVLKRGLIAPIRPGLISKISYQDEL